MEDNIITLLNFSGNYDDVANIRLMFPSDISDELAQGTLTIFNCRMRDFIRTHGYVSSIEFQVAVNQELRELNRLLKVWRLGEKVKHHSLYCLCESEDYSYMHSFMYRCIF